MLQSQFSFYFVALLSQFAPTRSVLRCYSCSSIADEGCANLFGLYVTYDELENRMKKDCSEDNSTACGTYLWVIQDPEVGASTADADPFHSMHIQRGCAYNPAEEYCQEVKSTIIEVLNITSFDEKTHCKTCSTSYCNHLPMMQFYNVGNDCRSRIVFVGCVVMASLFLKEIKKIM